MSLFFISDLHLDEHYPATTQSFIHFLETKITASSDLYILGDLFEVWIGDDYSNPLSEQVAEVLQQLTQNGCQVYFIAGNRDFLLGKAYAQKAGFTLLSDPHEIQFYDKTILLSHGDLLCTKDLAYMQFRAQTRNQEWQQTMLSKPLAERLQIATQYRQISEQQNRYKPEDIMDVTHEAVLELMTQHNVDIFIHGHTHRPAIHDIDLSHKISQRIVLGDWYQKAWYLHIDENTVNLQWFIMETP